MLSLAVRSIRHRPGRFGATLLCAFLGAVIIMTFHSLHDTAAGDQVDEVSSTTLGTSAGVVGGYGTLLVFFAIASTLTVNVRQRGAELYLLRCTGATPAQVKRMVVGESVAVAVVAWALAIVPAMVGGRMLLDMFQDSGQVAGGVDHVFGPIALSSGLTTILLAAAGAAFLAVRRATRAPAGAGRPGGRLVHRAGYAAVVAGTAGVLTTFALDEDDPALMAPAAYGAILLSIGLALLAPKLLHAVLGGTQGLFTAVAGASGYLTVLNLRQRATQLSSVLMPLVVFIGMATATLYIQTVESDAIEASGAAKSVDDKNLETLNLVVIGIIVAFSCIMLINSLYAATSYRRREFGQQRLAGATSAQVLGTVGVEGLVLTATGVVLGTLAGLAGMIPFTVARTDEVLPDEGLGLWLVIVAVGAAATLVTSLGTAHRALATPAVEAVAA